MFYANIQNEKLNGASQCKIISDDLVQVVITEDIFNNIERYEYKNGQIIEIENYDEKKAKEDKKAEILAQLDVLDLKTIRALRANDTEYIEKYENEAKILREELSSL